MQPVPGSRLSPQLIFGLFAVAAGVLLTLDNMGIVRIRHVWDYWPAVFVVMGLLMAARSRGARRTFGLGVALVSALLLLDNLDAVEFDLWDLWPLTIVLVGAAMVWRSVSKSRRSATLGTAMPGVTPLPGAGTTSGAAAAPSPDSYVRAFALFSNARHAVVATDFRGAELSAFFGTCEIDLRQASLAGPATVDVASVFGAIRVRVPLDWTVSVDGGFVGGIEVQTHPAPGTGKTLRVHGFAPLADVKITN
jgi:predicted membrane protein